MKTKHIQFSIVAILIGLFTISNSIAQNNEAKNFRMLYKFSTTKQADNSRLLEVSFIARHKKDRKNKVPVYNAEIKFYNVNDTAEVLLGTAKTDKKGFGRLLLPENQNYLTNDEGYINFEAVFEKTDAIKSYKKSIAVKDVFLNLDLKEIDSVKTVILKAYTLDSLKTENSVSEADIVFLVNGMISNMPIKEDTLEEGEYKFEFPENIPGNSEGTIIVYATIEDHEDYGNVIQQKSVNWGTFNEQINFETNTLWSDAAPIWMYVVLSILLIGVWANYVYSIVHLFKIKKEGKELTVESKKE